MGERQSVRKDASMQRPAIPTGGRGRGPVLPPGHKRVSSSGFAGAFVNQDHGSALTDNRGADIAHRQRMIAASETFQALQHQYGLRRAPRPVHPNSSTARAARSI
jgi:hypothetical protein